MRHQVGFFLSVTVWFFSASAYGISQVEWVSQMRQQVGPKLCQEYFANPPTAALMHQHNVTPAQCQVDIAQVFQRCANTYIRSMPSQMDGKSGQYWGERLGVCTAAGFQNQFMSTPVDKNTLRARLNRVNISKFCSSQYFEPILASQQISQTQCMQSMARNKQACIDQSLSALPQMVRPYKVSNSFMQCLIDRLKK